MRGRPPANVPVAAWSRTAWRLTKVPSGGGQAVELRLRQVIHLITIIPL
jgi:hypothetical protein